MVNATGSPVDPTTGRLWADREQRQPAPAEAERAALAAAYAEAVPSLATTIGVLLTDATLTKAQASRLATVGHDGMARAIAPVHSMLDGDTVFALASGRRPLRTTPAVGPGGLQPAAGRGGRHVHRRLPGRAARPLRGGDRGGPTASWPGRP